MLETQLIGETTCLVCMRPGLIHKGEGETDTRYKTDMDRGTHEYVWVCMGVVQAITLHLTPLIQSLTESRTRPGYQQVLGNPPISASPQCCGYRPALDNAQFFTWVRTLTRWTLSPAPRESLRQPSVWNMWWHIWACGMTMNLMSAMVDYIYSKTLFSCLFCF